MPLPLTYPPVSGLGRLTEICSFRKASIPQSEWDSTFNEIMSKCAKFPISQRSTLLSQVEDSGVVVLVADWTSAAEKDEFEPGEEYQSVKPLFGKIVDEANPSFACHHMILPGHSSTLEAAYYTVSHMHVPIGEHDEVAAAFKAYLQDVSGCASKDKDDLVFLAVAPSREDPSVLVCFSGHRSSLKEDESTPMHRELKQRLDKVVSSGTNYGGKHIEAWDMAS